MLPGADPAHALEGRAEGEGAAVADLAGHRLDGGAWLAQQVGGQVQPPAGEEGHRGLADQLRARRARVARGDRRPGCSAPPRQAAGRAALPWGAWAPLSSIWRYSSGHATAGPTNVPLPETTAFQTRTGTAGTTCASYAVPSRRSLRTPHQWASSTSRARARGDAREQRSAGAPRSGRSTGRPGRAGPRNRGRRRGAPPAPLAGRRRGRAGRPRPPGSGWRRRAGQSPAPAKARRTSPSSRVSRCAGASCASRRCHSTADARSGSAGSSITGHAPASGLRGPAPRDHCAPPV